MPSTKVRSVSHDISRREALWVVWHVFVGRYLNAMKIRRQRQRVEKIEAKLSRLVSEVNVAQPLGNGLDTTGGAGAASDDKGDE